MNAVPKSQFEPSGEAHGARFSNGSNIRSARVTKKKVEEEQGNEDDKEEDDNHVDLTDPPPASVPATKRAKSAAPQWTAKLEAALTASVKKWTGKASNGGIAWVHVQTDMHMTKHHVMSHWKKIEHAKAPPAPRKKPPPVRVFSPYLFLFIYCSKIVMYCSRLIPSKILVQAVIVQVVTRRMRRSRSRGRWMKTRRLN